MRIRIKQRRLESLTDAIRLVVSQTRIIERRDSTVYYSGNTSKSDDKEIVFKTSSRAILVTECYYCFEKGNIRTNYPKFDNKNTDTAPQNPNETANRYGSIIKTNFEKSE